MSHEEFEALTGVFIASVVFAILILIGYYL